jgi:2-polyprenyl-3-methyl-5-hydroxy-6-metoxy-1,4-benzoquinol methylase
MSARPEVLWQEAEFADASYSRYEKQLALSSRMFDRYRCPAHKWDWRQHSAMLLGDLRGKVLLDYGCGMGEEATYFAKLGAQVTAIDISTKGIEITKNRARYNGLADSVQAYVMDCLDVRLPAESFDIVHGFGILHHVGLHPGLQQVRQLLKPGGHAVFMEWMGNSGMIERVKTAVYAETYHSRKTEHEEPLRWRDIQNERKDWSSLDAYPYHLTYRMRNKFPVIRRSNKFEQLDYTLLSICPWLRHFAGGVVIHVWK